MDGWGLICTQPVWTQPSQGYGSPEKAPDLALGKMLLDRFLEWVAGPRQAPKGEGTGQGQDKRWTREAGGAQNLEPRRWDWIHGGLGSHEKCLNKRV